MIGNHILTNHILTNKDDEFSSLVSDATLIDLMSVIRRLSAVKIDNVTTFGSLCNHIITTIKSYGKKCEEIYLILENYKRFSIKYSERQRRAGDKPPGPLYNVVSDQQPLPDMKEFFTNLDNKISLQNFFVNYCLVNYTETKPLYTAGGLKEDPEKCLRIVSGEVTESTSLRASHEEADDRMMFTIQHLYNKSNTGRVTVVTADTDIIVVLLYHLKNNWKGLNLFLFKKGQLRVQGLKQNETYPLHLLLPKLDPNVVDCLPAGHSLTGCDTVAKVGTKNALRKSLEADYNLISDFGRDRLDDDIIYQAEQFLVRLISKTGPPPDTFDELRIKLYRQARQKSFIELPCSSNEIRQNIRRAYMQTRMWLESHLRNAAETLDPELYGYFHNMEDNTIEPQLFVHPSRPSDVPDPCKCKTCSWRTCNCRLHEMPCCNYCGCLDNNCKNPFS